MTPANKVKPSAGLSLDLDNLWTYLRSFGDQRWHTYPSFLGTAVPRIMQVFSRLNLRATIFVVGRDADQPAHTDLLTAIVAAGHEIGNHSYDHHPAFNTLDVHALHEDFERSEASLATLFTSATRGFRAPSFGISATMVETLIRRGYVYDTSLFPSSIGPLARLWERLRFERNAEDEHERAGSYGGFRAARRPLAPFAWSQQAHSLPEFPVSTMPYTRLPVHWTYLNYLADVSPLLARGYLQTHIRLLRRTAIEPVLLLHATDFLGADDADIPHFMPGMRREHADKLEFLVETLEAYLRFFTLEPLGCVVGRRLARERMLDLAGLEAGCA